MTDAVVVPDFTEPFVGWRAWGIRQTAAGVRLMSVFGGTIWPTNGPLEAECDDQGHVPPGDGCSCGVYALTRDVPYYSYDGGSCVFGEVFLYGEVIRGTLGFRAQRAWPKALFVAHKDWRLVAPLRQSRRSAIAANGLSA